MKHIQNIFPRGPIIESDLADELQRAFGRRFHWTKEIVSIALSRTVLTIDEPSVAVSVVRNLELEGDYVEIVAESIGFSLACNAVEIANPCYSKEELEDIAGACLTPGSLLRAVLANGWEENVRLAGVLKDALASNDPAVRRAAYNGFGLTRWPEADAALLRGCDDADLENRAYARRVRDALAAARGAGHVDAL